MTRMFMGRAAGPNRRAADDVRQARGDWDAYRPVVLAAAACMLVSRMVSPVLGAAIDAPAPLASSVQVAPGVIRPGETADEADMARRPTGIDAEFVDKAGIVGQTQLRASQLALDRSSNPDVKAFARKMLDDHDRMTAELRKLGARKGLPVQAKMLVDPAVTALRARTGHAFDIGYVAIAGPAAHESAIKLYEAEARDGRDPQLRAFAAAALPTLNAHLSAARALAKSVDAAH
ncbi:putative membrane protein [Burkholderia latens]